MTPLFLSFRTEDEPYGAAQLDQELCRLFGDEAIFFAPRSVAPGADWERTIFQSVVDAKAVLVAIGPRWLTAEDENGARRLDDPADFVRREVELALREGNVVIPVHLEQRHRMDARSLPASLRPLAAKQGVVVGFRDSKIDIAKLAAKLRVKIPSLRPAHAAASRTENGGGKTVGIVEHGTVIQGDGARIGSIHHGDIHVDGDFTAGPRFGA